MPSRPFAFVLARPGLRSGGPRPLPPARAHGALPPFPPRGCRPTERKLILAGGRGRLVGVPPFGRARRNLRLAPAFFCFCPRALLRFSCPPPGLVLRGTVGNGSVSLSPVPCFPLPRPSPTSGAVCCCGPRASLYPRARGLFFYWGVGVTCSAPAGPALRAFGAHFVSCNLGWQKFDCSLDMGVIPRYNQLRGDVMQKGNPRVCIRLTQAQKKLLFKAAGKEGISVSYLVRQALQLYFLQTGKDPSPFRD